jgi:integrase/recombinase XerC
VKSRLRFKLDGMPGEIHAVASADVEKLLGKCDDKRYEAVILLASEAGLRAAEIRGLQWTDIKSGQITVRRTLDKMTNEAVAPKHNKPRTIPMSKRLAACLASLPRRSLWVVSEQDGACVTYDRMIDTVHALYDRAGVARPPKALHCLRHTFGTVMARRVPLPVLQKLMGHSDVQTTLRYIE